MALFPSVYREFVETIDALVYVNPFTAERLELEKKALGDAFGDEEDAWRSGPGHRNRNLSPLFRKVKEVIQLARQGLPGATARETEIYVSMVRYRLYYDHEDTLFRLSQATREGNLRKVENRDFDRFSVQLEEMVEGICEHRHLIGEAHHLWALAFQLRRAFEQIFLGIVGASVPAMKLRAAVWESVFTHDMRRYQRSLFDRMQETNTLIMGPSGTGKEVVARAIGESRYIPFDPQTRRFTEETHGSFLPINISALAGSLVESELFGHKRGSFTGATTDREGFLESCPDHGTVFLDEIGELSHDVQVKLLRTLQERELSRIGERKSREFRGKVVTATNRDLAQEVEAGTFREDFFFRLCADSITTPSLAAQLEDCPADLPRLIAALLSRIVPAQEIDTLKVQASDYIAAELSAYHWPGNVREMEQCLRSLVVHGYYRPGRSMKRGSVAPQSRALKIGQRMIAGDYSLDEISDLYVTLAYQRYGNYSETARQLELDRRTVRTRVRPELLRD